MFAPWRFQKSLRKRKRLIRFHLLVYLYPIWILFLLTFQLFAVFLNCWLLHLPTSLWNLAATATIEITIIIGRNVNFIVIVIVLTGQLFSLKYKTVFCFKKISPMKSKSYFSNNSKSFFAHAPWNYKLYKTSTMFINNERHSCFLGHIGKKTPESTLFKKNLVNHGF